MFKQINWTFCRHFPLFQVLAVNSGIMPLCSNPPNQTCILSCESASDYGEKTFPLIPTCIFKVMVLTIVFDMSGRATRHKATKCEVHYDGHPWWKLRIFLLNCGFVHNTTQCKMISGTMQHIKKIYSFFPRSCRDFCTTGTQHFWTDVVRPDAVRKLLMWSSFSWLSEVFVLTAWGRLTDAERLYIEFYNCYPLEAGDLYRVKIHTHCCFFLRASRGVGYHE